MIHTNDKAALAWCASMVGCTVEGWQYPKAISLHDDDGTIVACVVYERISRHDCNAHIAVANDRRLTRAFMLEIFHYPFVQLGLRRITGLVDESNNAALRFDHHLGFQVEGVLRGGCGDTDLIVLGMLKEECRFLPRAA